jgi:hypothetical protein
MPQSAFLYIHLWRLRDNLARPVLQRRNELIHICFVKEKAPPERGFL